MDKYLNCLSKIAITAFFCLSLSYAAFAQAGNPGGSLDEPNIPIDGGASILAAAGVAYGVKKYRDTRKGSAEETDPE